MKNERKLDILYRFRRALHAQDEMLGAYIGSPYEEMEKHELKEGEEALNDLVKFFFPTVGKKKK